MGYLYILFYFLPFLFLFYTGIEIFLRDPRNVLHRMTMCLILSFSLLFLGDLFAHMLPLTESDAGFRIKLAGGFLTMCFGLYFFNTLSKTTLKPGLYHVIAILPLAGAIPLLFPESLYHYERPAGSFFLKENYEPAYLYVIYSAAAYAMIGFIFQAANAYLKVRFRAFSHQERKRLRIILLGSLISCGWVFLAEFAIKPMVQNSPYIPLTVLDSFAVIIFALYIRHAMINYDFLSTAARRYRILFDQSSHGIFLLDHRGRLVEINPAGLKMMGFPPESLDWKGMLLIDVVALEEESQYEVFRHAIENKQPLFIESQICNRLGEHYIVESRTDYVEVEGHFWTYITNTDVTLQKENERKLKELAYYDSLTGLLNRRRMMEILTDTVNRPSKDEDPFAVLVVDLDRFKSLNDTFGHAAGDELLTVVARRLMMASPENAYVARMGGDEFVILLLHVTGADQALSTARRISEELNKPVPIRHADYEITASIGIRIAEESQPDVESILLDADAAMYAAKQSGRNRFRLHEGPVKGEETVE
jgi:diguanylate cyclase (GGDEF)-like protein/PAS domain S-box-containing protein